MQETIINIINDYGYLGVFLLIFIENIFPPIPSEVVLAFGGFVTHTTSMTPMGVIASSTIGSLAGAIVLYYCGYICGKDGIKKLFATKPCRLLRLNKLDIDAADKWFCKYEAKAVFFCRCIPIIRSVISIPAGISKMKMGQFLLLTVIGSFIWNSVLIWIGVFSMDAWEQSVQKFSVYGKAVLATLLLIVAIVIILKVKNRNKK